MNAEHPETLFRALDFASLREREGLVIGEIAGRDSVAALVEAVRGHAVTTILPTVAFAGTEFGDAEAPLRAVEYLRERVGKRAEVLKPVELSSPRLWAALNSRFAAEITRRFGIYSACLACHLYMHLLRVPLSWALGNAPIVAGERDTHAGAIKLSQTVLSINASREILLHAGIELMQPIRHLKNNSAIESLVGTDWPQDDKQLECLLSGNYRSADGSVTYDEVAYARYVHEFLVPVGRAIVAAWRTEPDPRYQAIVRAMLEIN
ncbi:MAG: hypothetical protein JXE06_10430 [Coriobacteriia bacterium]|nr:hypothetical protein [Coriobacteriia bacterium]MBN2822378.1 hypothetical protein [Coriobacteriia bacterium]